MQSATRMRGGREVALRRAVAAGAVAVIAAVLLLWLLGRSLDRSHDAAADSRVAADVQIARATLQEDVASAARRAAALARLTRTQQALARNDAAGLAALAAAHRGALLVAAGGARGGALPPHAITRTADVVVGGRRIGRVVTAAPLDADFLARVDAALPSSSRDVLAVAQGDAAVAGPLPPHAAIAAGAPRTVHVAGRTYRALGSPLAADRPDLRIVALASRGDTFMSGWRLPLAVAATLAAVGVLVALIVSLTRRRAAAAQQQRAQAPAAAPPPEQVLSGPVALLGETLASTHDAEALLSVILDAAIDATGAVGGTLLRGRGTGSRVGEPQRGSLTIPLETNEPGGSSLVLYPPPNGFTAEAANVAHWLGVQASTAIRNARLHRLIERQAITDELTGLANRRHFTATLRAELARAERFATPLSVLLSDLDNFKRVNDTFGHARGDEILGAFARALQRGVREIDLAARIGGDEFAVLLPQTDAEGARQVAERLRLEFQAEPGVPPYVSASFGVSSYPHSGSEEELLVAADVCLYQAKEAGRNRVVMAAAEPRAQRRA